MKAGMRARRVGFRGYGKIKGLTVVCGFHQFFQCSRQRYGDETWYHFDVISFANGNAQFK